VAQGGKAHVHVRRQHRRHRQVISVCTPVSISGCHFAGAGTPNSASISGNSTFSAPQSRSVWKKTCGLRVVGAFRLFPDALWRQVFQLAGLGHGGHQRHGFIGNAEAQMGVAGGKTRHAQHAQRIFAKRGETRSRRCADRPGRRRVDNLAVGVLGQRVDRQIAAQQIGSSVTSGAA
jgi:hypothetical protein